MEHFFIVLACFVVIGVKAYLSSTSKEAENKPAHPQPFDPEERTEDEECPTVTLPEEGVRTTYVPSQPKRKRKEPKSHAPIPVAEEAHLTAEEAAGGETEWNLHSAEEARRAIVWGEILKPKF